VLMDVIHRHDSWIPFSLSSLRLSVSQHFYSNKCFRDWRTASARYYVSADKSAETKGTLGTDEWKVRYFQERREWRALLLTSLYLSHYIQQKDGRLPHANHTHTHTHTPASSIGELHSKCSWWSLTYFRLTTANIMG
jgi:hypothetical protein